MPEAPSNVSQNGAYDVLFYMPWMGPLLTAGGASPPGGAETQILLIARALAGRGLRVCLMAFDTAEGLPSRIGEVDVIPRRPYKGNQRWIGKLREAVSIWRTLRHLEAGVIVTRAQGPHVGILGVFCLLWRRRFVYSSAHVADFTSDLERLRRNRLMYQMGVRLAHAIVVQTEEQVVLCRQVFGREPVRINSLAEPAAPGDANPDAFLWIARLVWYKQPLKYLELARALPDAKFRLVGVPGPPGHEYLTEEVRREAATVPNVELIDPRPRDELLKLMDGAVAIVNTADAEGMPNIFLEGWARGVPALALAHDPDGVITRHGLGCFAEGSMAKLTGCAQELWTARADREALSRRCRRYIEEHHSSDSAAEKWVALIRAITTKKAAAGDALLPDGSRESDLHRVEQGTSEAA